MGENSSPGKWLLTGPTGSVGSLFLRSLKKKDLERLVVVNVTKPKKLPKSVTFYKVDLTQPTVDARLAEILEREKVETVIHTAILWGPGHQRTYAHEVEVIGTIHLLNACHQQSVKKFLLVSSTLVYGAKPNNPNYLTESHPLYGGFSKRFVRDKVEVEQEVRKFRKRHPRSNVTVLRPCMVVGPTVRNYVTAMLSSPAVPTVLGYDPLVQFVHEDDLVRSMHLALNSDAYGEFNIVGRGVMPLSKAIKVSGRLNVPLIYSFARPLMAALSASEVYDFPPELLDNLRYLWVSDGAKAERDLQFVPKYSSQEALESFTGEERLRKLHLTTQQRQAEVA